MTERESHEQRRAEHLFDDTEGLPAGEQPLEDAPDIQASLSPDELEDIKRVAEELGRTLAEGINTLPLNLVLPDEPEPPFPSEQAHESEEL